MKFDYKPVLKELENYLEETNKDKYVSSPIDTGGLIKHNSDLAKGYLVGNATKYISRYFTANFEKSGNRKDLFKAVHYLLFEIMRISKNETGLLGILNSHTLTKGKKGESWKITK